MYKTSSGKSMNEKVISLHLLEDVLGWVAIFIVSVIMIFTDLIILDPILSILITLYILWWVLKNLRKTVLLFLQASPEEISVDMIDNTLKEKTGIQWVHDTHVWSLDGEHNVMTTHVVVDADSSISKIKYLKWEVRKTLEKMGITHSTIEVDFTDEKCDNSCD